MVNTAPPTVNSTSGNNTEARREVDAARDTVQTDLADIKDKASEDLHGITEAAKRDFDEARGAAGRFAETRKNEAADQVDGVASAVRRLADDLDGENPTIGRYAREIGDGLARFSESARNRSLGEMLDDVQRLGRQHPGAFIAGAAALGFAASRFLAASSHRTGEAGSNASGSADATRHAGEVSSTYAQQHPARSYADTNRVAAPEAMRAGKDDF